MLVKRTQSLAFLLFSMATLILGQKIIVKNLFLLWLQLKIFYLCSEKELIKLIFSINIKSHKKHFHDRKSRVEPLDNCDIIHDEFGGKKKTFQCGWKNMFLNVIKYIYYNILPIACFYSKKISRVSTQLCHLGRTFLS